MDKINLDSIVEVKKQIKDLQKINDAKECYLFYKDLKEFVDVNNMKEIDLESYKAYEELIFKLKFLSINFIDDWGEITELIRNHLDIIFSLEDYDLWGKIKTNLMVVSSLEERDKIKEDLKRALLSCENVVIDNKKYDKNISLLVTVKDWLNDYNVNLGIKEVDQLKKAQYLNNGENIRKLNNKDRDNLKIIFDFYENIKTSSNTPQGYEEDVPMVINNKNIIFTQGEAREITSDIMNLIKSIITDNNEIKSAKTGPINASSYFNDKEQELLDMVEKFPAGSLERKAIDEEIKKLMKK